MYMYLGNKLRCTISSNTKNKDKMAIMSDFFDDVSRIWLENSEKYLLMLLWGLEEQLEDWSLEELQEAQAFSGLMLHCTKSH